MATRQEIMSIRREKLTNRKNDTKRKIIKGKRERKLKRIDLNGRLESQNTIKKAP